MTYNIKKIAHELDETARGLAYYGNALYVAMDIPGMSQSERLCIQAHLHGTDTASDGWRLQRIAIRLLEDKFEVTEHCIMTAVYLNSEESASIVMPDGAIHSNGFTIGKSYAGTRTFCDRTKHMPWVVINDNGDERSVDHLGDGGGHLYWGSSTVGRFIIQVMAEHSVKVLMSNVNRKSYSANKA